METRSLNVFFFFSYYVYAGRWELSEAVATRQAPVN